MIKILILFLLFTLSPILSANINPNSNFINDGNLKAKVSHGEILSHKILEKLEGSPNIPNSEILHLAISGYLKLLEQSKIEHGSPLSIIDYSLPSSTERFWIIDMEDGNLLYKSLVSHGRNSGSLMAKKFSNINSSYMSSIGFYLTGETYLGKHGYSLRLDGLEKGFNNNARERAIVIHGAEYADRNFVRTTGRLGRSLGCPALPMASYRKIINTIKEGSCLFIYGNDESYLNNSSLINS